MIVVKPTISILFKKNQDSTICYLQKILFEHKATDSLKGKIQKKIYHANTKQRKPKQNPDVVVLTLDEVDFRMKNIIRDKVGYIFFIIKGLIYQEDMQS